MFATVLAESSRGFLLQQGLDLPGACFAVSATARPALASSQRPPHSTSDPGPPQAPASSPALCSRSFSASHHFVPCAHLRPLCASYVYLSMSYYFGHNDVALKNLAKYFLPQAQEAMEHGQKLMKLQNQPGSRIFLQDIGKPDRDSWEKGLKAMESALHLGKSVSQSPLDQHKWATHKNDPRLCDFLETHYLNEQVKSIKELGDHITNLRRFGGP